MSRILLVEDDPLIATVLRAILSRGTWEVRHAATGEDAVAVAAAWNPSLILLDVDLPGMNGFEVCATVRATEQGDTPLIVMVTANDDVRSKLTGFQAGADDYLVKPVDPQELFTRVTKLMGAREAQARAIAQRRREAMNEIVATICHELNSPLTGALGYLEMAMADAKTPRSVAALLEDCRRETLKVISIVQRLKKVEDRVVPYIGNVTMISLPEDPAAQKPLVAVEKINPDDPEGLDDYFP